MSVSSTSSKRAKRYKYDLYISYHPAQRELVRTFCDQINKNENIRIWCDESCSSSFNVRALQSSEMFICFPSKEYKKSIKNRIEYSIAIEQDMKIITVDEYLIENAPLEHVHPVDQQTTKHIQSSINENFINSFFKLIKNQTEIFSQKLYKFVRF